MYLQFYHGSPLPNTTGVLWDQLNYLFETGIDEYRVPCSRIPHMVTTEHISSAGYTLLFFHISADTIFEWCTNITQNIFSISYSEKGVVLQKPLFIKKKQKTKKTKQNKTKKIDSCTKNFENVQEPCLGHTYFKIFKTVI